MKSAPEYIDDGSGFIAIDPLSINPDSQARFAFFERHPAKNNMFRFRCLLKDTRDMDKQRLINLLENWGVIYLHKADAPVYKSYIRDNIEFVLNHGSISTRQKTEALVSMSSEVIREAFAANLSVSGDVEQLVKNVEGLVSRALDFISDIGSLEGLATLIGHDYDTHTHSIKVGWLMAVFIHANPDLFEAAGSRELKSLVLDATVSGFLHDIGKVKIPQNVINKPGRLDNLEYILMQSHTAYAASMLFESPLPRTSIQTILYHHENEDGSGYPCGLSGDRIPLLAKICHIADVFDALTSRRPYKAPKTPFEALRLMAGENPYLETLKRFEAEVMENAKPPVTAIVRDDYEAKLRRLREREMLEEEMAKRVEARLQLRDKGMSHCFDVELLKRFIITINRSESFDLSGLL